jgi:type II secretory pathway pseudopilin PulG
MHFPSIRNPQSAIRNSAGFTILEILMATAILTIGLVCVLSLFPIAIDSGKRVMEQSTAVTIAKSVAEQIRTGLRNQKRYVYTGAEPSTYFVFQHDGVQDPVPRDSNLEKPSGDYYILLPRFKTDTRFEGGDGATEEERDSSRREKAVAQSMEFVYPEVDTPMNGNGNPFTAHDDSKDAPDGGILVKKVYSLGNFFPRFDANLDDQRVLDDQVTESFKQYSYAFSIRASKFDANVNQNPKIFQPGNALYHVRVMIFRSFTYNDEKVRVERKGQDPVYELDFEVAP